MKILLIAGVSLILIACSSTSSEPVAKPAPAGASGTASSIRRYPMHGKILSIDTTEKSARIQAGPLGDWMGPMTMNYPIKDAADLAKLSSGETIDATVFVDGDDFWVGEIKPAR